MSKTKQKDIKKVIKAFIDHVDALENAEDIDGNGFNKEYQLMQEAQIRNRSVITTDVGKMENNLKKNRYKDILPYDKDRIVLDIINEDPESDYINASKLMGVRGTGGYIASQGPLAATVNDFWRMIWEKKVEIVFMACRIVEMGKIKCKQYWNDLNNSEEFGDITVFTEAEEEILTDCKRRNFRVTKGGEVRHVIQYHYTGWPDHGIPKDPGHIRDMIGYMRQTKHNDQTPLLVHCSAGCGRTGAIIAIDYVWTLLEEGLFDETFNLFDLICKFREQRMSLVQTPEQYALVNEVLKSLCEEWLKKMAGHTYENVDLGQTGNSIDHTCDRTNDPEAGENIYEDGCVSTQDQQTECPTTNDDGPEKAKVSPNGKMTYMSPAYENVFQYADSEVENSALQAQQTSTINGEKIHKTVIKVVSSGSTNQPQSPDSGAGSIRKAPAAVPQSPKPQQSIERAAYGAANSGPRSPAQLQSHRSQSLDFHRSQPLDPHRSQSLPHEPQRSQPPEAEHVYSEIRKKTSRAPDLPPIKAPAEAAYSVVNKTSPGSQQHQPSKEEAAYSIVNKTSPDLKQNQPSTEEPTAVKCGSSGSVSSVYEVIDISHVPGRSFSCSSAELGGRNSNTSSSGSSKSPRQMNSGLFSPPGFSERLPRVRGPVPMPSAWNKI